MNDPIQQQLQQHARRLSAEVAAKLQDAKQHPNSPPDLIKALERVEAAAKALSDEAYDSGEGKPSHD